MEPTSLQRALAVAPERAAEGAARPEQEFFCFRLGDLRLGVPSEHVREVVHAARMTPLPRCPAFVLGVCGHRGEVLPVLDLLRFLGKGESKVGTRARLFVGLWQTYVAGVLCDSVIGLRRIPISEITPPPLGGDAATEYLQGVVADPGGGEKPLSLLDFAKLLQVARQRAVTR